MLFLDRIDSAPISNGDFDVQFLQWLWVLVDTLNEVISDVQDAVLSQELVTDIAQLIDVNSIYIPTNAALTTFTLPDECIAGNRVSIAGFSPGGWKLLTGAGQTIKIASTASSATTSIASSSRYDSIELICVQDDTTWITLSTQTSGFVIV